MSNMKITAPELEGLLVVELKKLNDDRGFFTELFNEGRFESAGLPKHFYQQNWSQSKPGVVRGLHYQYNPKAPGDINQTQGKLVTCIHGSIWDVAVDIRPHSPTFGRYFSIELKGGSGTMLWIPSGFAHGFCVIGSEPADVIYQVDCPYDAPSEGGILWNDSTLQVAWPLGQSHQNAPLTSPKDEILPTFEQYQQKIKQRMQS